MYMEAPYVRGWKLKAVTGRELFGQSWAGKGFQRCGHCGAQSPSLYALMPNQPIAVYMGWASDDEVALVQCDCLLGSDQRERWNSFLYDAR
jgi:hypothetical protein